MSVTYLFDHYSFLLKKYECYLVGYYSTSLNSFLGAPQIEHFS